MGVRDTMPNAGRTVIATSTIPAVTGGHVATVENVAATSGTKIVAETPLSLEAAQEALILRFAHLKERLPKLTETAAKATEELRTLKADLEQTERTLRAMTRIRTPRHRGTSK